MTPERTAEGLTEDEKQAITDKVFLEVYPVTDLDMAMALWAKDIIFVEAKMYAWTFTQLGLKVWKILEER